LWTAAIFDFGFFFSQQILKFSESSDGCSPIYLESKTAPVEVSAPQASPVWRPPELA
jgi:hypothetical protein